MKLAELARVIFQEYVISSFRYLDSSVTQVVGKFVS